MATHFNVFQLMPRMNHIFPLVKLHPVFVSIILLNVFGVFLFLRPSTPFSSLEDDISEMKQTLNQLHAKVDWLLKQSPIMPTASTSQDSLVLYVLGHPAKDPTWNDSAIFGGDHNFITIGIESVHLKAAAFLGYGHKTGFICYKPVVNGTSSSQCSTLTATSSTVNVSSFGGHNVTHLYLKSNDDAMPSVLITALYDISPDDFSSTQRGSYYFSYGLPPDFYAIRQPDVRTNACPPGLCGAVYSGRTLRKKLALLNGAEPDVGICLLANFLLKHSRFIPCLTKNETMISKPQDVYLVGDTPAMPANAIWGVRELFERNGMPLVLEGGTMLGWYRNCSVILNDLDADFAVPNAFVNESFYEHVRTSAYEQHTAVIETLTRSDSYYSKQDKSETDNEYAWMKTTRVFGDKEFGMEIRYDSWISHDGGKTWDQNRVGIDIFVLYMNVPGLNYSYEQGFLSWQHQIMHYALPRDLTLCSAVFLGDIYLVPCQPEFYLVSHYGEGWRYPEERKTEYWNQQPNIVKRLNFSAQEWNRRVMTKTFE